MEIIKVQVARAVWLFDTQDLNPRGISLYEPLAALATKFQFAGWPTPEDCGRFSAAHKSMFFKQGTFLYEGLRVDIDFDIHPDGLVANTHNSTEASESFLEEFLKWASNNLQTTCEGPRERQYRSELAVRMSPNFETFSERVEEYTHKLSDMFGQPTVFTGIIFGSELTTGVLTIERRANTKFSDNQYFSISALQTGKHVEALVALEALPS